MSLFSQNSFDVGRIFGVPIRIDISLIILIGYFILKAGSPIVGLLYAAAVIISVLLHELGHIFVGQIFGSRVRDVTLMFFGGCATMYGMPRNPWKETAIAAAGPAVGGILWLVCPILAALIPINALALLVLLIGDISGWLALFNLIPAFPMDGGRIFRSILSMYKGHMWATRVSCRIAYILAAVMGLWGLTHFDPFLIIIAFFVWSSARNELMMMGRFSSYDDDDDTIIISPPPYGDRNDYTSRKR